MISYQAFSLSNIFFFTPDFENALGWKEAEDQFLNLAPDFVMEIRSKSDSLSKLQQKMREYRENGVKLGWLLDPQNKQAFVYRQDGSITQYPHTSIYFNRRGYYSGLYLQLKTGVRS